MSIMDAFEYDKMYRLEETNWWYAGRRDAVLKIGASIYKDTFESLRILDAGCGTGINLESLQNNSNAYGLDISKDALKFSKIRGLQSLVCGSVIMLPFRDEIFDLVFALDVIEHVDEDRAAIRELYRILKPDGRLIITVPAFQFLWSEHDQAHHHRRRYTRSALINILQLGGFENEKATYWNSILFLPVSAVRLLKRSQLSAKGSRRTDLEDLPSFLNRLLMGLLMLENRILERFDLPFGISVICLCRKV